jgi:hypothetical protein
VEEGLHFYTTNRHIEGYTKVLLLFLSQSHLVPLTRRMMDDCTSLCPLAFGAVSGTVWYYILAFANDDETG